jgi:hypothetical protein
MLAQGLTERAPHTELGHVHHQRVAVHRLGTLEPPRAVLPVAGAFVEHDVVVVSVVKDRMLEVCTEDMFFEESPRIEDCLAAGPATGGSSERTPLA